MVLSLHCDVSEVTPDLTGKWIKYITTDQIVCAEVARDQQNFEWGLIYPSICRGADTRYSQKKRADKTFNELRKELENARLPLAERFCIRSIGIFGSDGRQERRSGSYRGTGSTAQSFGSRGRVQLCT